MNNILSKLELIRQLQTDIALFIKSFRFIELALFIIISGIVINNQNTIIKNHNMMIDYNLKILDNQRRYDIIYKSMITNDSTIIKNQERFLKNQAKINYLLNITDN